MYHGAVSCDWKIMYDGVGDAAEAKAKVCLPPSKTLFYSIPQFRFQQWLDSHFVIFICNICCCALRMYIFLDACIPLFWMLDLYRIYSEQLKGRGVLSLKNNVQPWKFIEQSGSTNQRCGIKCRVVWWWSSQIWNVLGSYPNVGYLPKASKQDYQTPFLLIHDVLKTVK